MMMTLPALCMASAFLSTVSCLKCTFCSVVIQRIEGEAYSPDVQMSDEASCDGPVYPCSLQETACASVYVLAEKYDKSREIFFKRQCVEPQDCNANGSLTTPGWKVSYSITCCGTEGCTPEQPVLPVQDTRKNGIYCPGCYSKTEQCLATHSMECTGEEKLCLTYRVTNLFSTHLQFSTSGCATMNVCRQSRKLEFLSRPRSLHTTSCTKLSSQQDLPPGHFIWCHFCHDYNVEDCVYQPYMCAPDEDVCLFERTRNIYEGRQDTEIFKRCGRSMQCSRAGTIRSESKIITTNATCCNKNVCSAPLPELPSTSEVDNGLICPACFVPNSDRCLGRNDLKCTGNEKRCVNFMRTEIQDTFSMTESLHGCTTDQICDAGSSLTHAKGNFYKTIKTDVICNSAFTQHSAIVCLVMFMVMALCVFKADIIIY